MLGSVISKNCLQWLCSVQAACFIIFYWYFFQRGQIKNHSISKTLPDCYDDDRQHSCLGTADPFQCRKSKDTKNCIGKTSILPENPGPYNGNGNGRCDPWGKQDKFEKSASFKIFPKQKCQSQSTIAGIGINVPAVKMMVFQRAA